MLCVSVFLGAEPLTAVFNSEHDPQLAAYAESGLRIYFTGFLFAGVNMVTAAFFSASDKTVQGFVLSLLRGVIAVPPILFPARVGARRRWRLADVPDGGAGHGGRRTRLGAEVHH